MNIGYHYYTIKTLAVKAGFGEEDAQIIAFYSQMIDDFVLSNVLLLNSCPPDFFLKNGLAKKVGEQEWMFLPCPTGIDMIKSVSHNYQRHTLVPFHFIPIVPLPEIERKQNEKKQNEVGPQAVEDMQTAQSFNRLAYRCQRADLSLDMLIVELLYQAVEAAKQEKSHKNLMRLGMTLHTYADTYAHCNFSGLHGYENEARVKNAWKSDGSPGISEAEIFFFKDLPSIGHGNVGSVPDICTYRISYAMKSSPKSGLDYIVERDNAQFFSECSRDIFHLLCTITGKKISDDREWDELRANLIKAQTVKKDEKKYLTPSWNQVFPHISYEYSKNVYFMLDMIVEEMEGYLLDSPGERVAQEVLKDAFSCEGNQHRNRCQVRLNNATQEFFDYNELAYKRVKAVTGEYRSQILS